MSIAAAVNTVLFEISYTSKLFLLGSEKLIPTRARPG